MSKSAVPESALPEAGILGRLAPIHAQVDRLFQLTVCLRPFRAAGPRIEAERVGDTLVIHNYGHGGSGWSLGWGSAAIVAPIALADSVRDIAVIGCGALGLTSAVLLQRAGARVTLYARAFPPDPNVRSSRATGSWTPDARIALAACVTPTFASRWEQMARFSFARYQDSLGLAGNPVEYTDRYALSDLPPDNAIAERERQDPIGFAHLNHRLDDLIRHSQDFAPGTHPFPTEYCRRTTNLQFNIADYSRQLLEEFRTAGGKLQYAEFHTPADLAALPQKVVVHCTGFGARALFSDHSIIPIRGQIAWLLPQPEVTYGLTCGNLSILSRRAGIIVQANEQGDASGFNDDNEQPDTREAEAAVRLLAGIYAGMGTKQLNASKYA